MSGRTKAERLEEMKRLYIQRAFTDIEMAERMGVDRTIVFRDRRELATGDNNYPFEKDDEGRYYIPKNKLISEVKLNLHEALTLYLAGRKTSRQTRFHQPHTVNAVEKLAVTLRQPMTERLLKSAEKVTAQEKNPEKVKIIETIAQAWVEQRKVRIEYQALGSDGLTRHTINPYIIEPSIWSDSVYVIAQSDFNDQIFAFKMDRILSAVLSGETFEIPESFNDEELLKHAWGIWYGNKEPEQVKLRFSPAVTRRVKESIWHPLEKVEDTEDGGCIWSAELVEWREMLPWVRGWGVDCEVLEPKELREALTREAQSLAELYQVVEMKKRFYAHTKDDKNESEWQPLTNHLNRVADYASNFGRDAGVSDLAKIAGLTHDLGKYSKEFQSRLRGAKIKVDHSTAGAQELTRLFNGTPQESLAALLAYCISGHHTGLLDYGDSTDLSGEGTLQARLKTQVCDYSAYKTELDLSKLEFPKWLNIHPLSLRLDQNKPPKNYQGFSVAFLTRMIYSALVDADFQETQEFMDEKKPRGEYQSIEDLCTKFNIAMQKFDNPQNKINKKRTETLKACIEKSNLDQGFFTLTIPTGGGKTETSMAFALNHAVKHGLKRVIYVIPFTTIIEQNAGKFKKYLGEENILEHHSNFDWEKKRESIETAEDQTKSIYAKLKLAAENWDIPIIATTNVQFFESLFANKSSRCRKLHNIAKSVIVFDEAQMFPKDYMLPAMGAVWELVKNYGASAVFCTATQPKLERFLPEETQITELTPNPSELFDFYKRVEVKNLGKLPDEKLIDQLNSHDQVLCIVNTRKHASGLFGKLKKLNGEGNYHLSTLMCPVHRKEKLAEICKRLDPENKQPCRVISTSLMEAGIDVDFPLGYRALTGLDSINQAAGRVNRNMRYAMSQMFVFDPDSEFISKTPRYVAQGIEVARSVLRDYRDEPISIPAIEAYFERLYALKEPHDFDINDVLSKFYLDQRNQPIFNFADVAENFRIIEENMETVIIPYDEEAKKLIEELKFTQHPSSTLRKLQPYTVSIFEDGFKAISNKGVILTIADAYSVLNPDKFEEYYSLETGLLVPVSGGGDAIIA